MLNNSTPIWPEFSYDMQGFIHPDIEPGIANPDKYVRIKYSTLLRKRGPRDAYHFIPIMSEYQFEASNKPPIMTVLRQFIREVYKAQQLYHVTEIGRHSDQIDNDFVPEEERVRALYAPWIQQTLE